MTLRAVAAPAAATVSTSAVSTFPAKTDFRDYGRRVASFSTSYYTSSNANDIGFDIYDYPPTLDLGGLIRTVKLLKSTTATPSWIQQSPIDYSSSNTAGLQGYLSDSASAAAPGLGLTAGIWVKNPMTRTLNFELKFYNQNGTHNFWWVAAVEPSSLYPNSNGWVFLTLSPTQRVNAGGGNTWVNATDTVSYVRVSQIDNGYEGPWVGGEYLLVSNVYVDCSARPTFMLGFDDGYSDQRNPGLTPIASGAFTVASWTATELTLSSAYTGLQIGSCIKFTGMGLTAGLPKVPTDLVVGTKYYVSTIAGAIITLTTDADLLIPAPMTLGSGICHWRYAGTQLRSSQQIVESYGFKGNLFIVPLWLNSNGTYAYTGTANKFLTTDELIDMHNEGWSVGSHSNTHPASADFKGLRLLGPYGYFLSNTFDNMSPNYVSTWAITAGTGRRRAISALNAGDVVTFENSHQFLINQPIVFTDAINIPTGLTAGVTYYVKSRPSGASCTFATDQGTLLNTASITADWNPVSSDYANYQHPGATNDSTAIRADIEAGIAGLEAIGITSGRDYFALPQGAVDEYVREACIGAGLGWVRGIAVGAHTIMVGKPSGGASGQSQSGGWISQLDSIQTDGDTPTITTIKSYVDELITLGACGCSYHHSAGISTLANLDNTCKYLKTKSDAGLIDVLTLDQMTARQVRT